MGRRRATTKCPGLTGAFKALIDESGISQWPLIPVMIMVVMIMVVMMPAVVFTPTPFAPLTLPFPIVVMMVLTDDNPYRRHFNHLRLGP